MMVGGLVFLGLLAVGLVWRWLTPSGQRFHATVSAQRSAAAPQVLSTVGQQAGGAGLACPKCGGTQFKAHRLKRTKLAFGFGSLLGEARHVRCVTCGTDYLRG